MATALTEGMMAPDFALAGDGDQTLSLSDLRGKPVVVYFYPKDDTPGCTKEAVGFSCISDDFAALGVSVIGISPDSAASHAKFRAKHGLTIALAADPDHQASEAYGVWGEKSMYGKTYMGVERSTFLVGADGRLARVWPKVKVPGHVEEVLAAARQLVGG